MLEIFPDISFMHTHIHIYLRVAYVRTKLVTVWKNLPSKTKEIMLEVREKKLKLVETKQSLKVLEVIVYAEVISKGEVHL